MFALTTVPASSSIGAAFGGPSFWPTSHRVGDVTAPVLGKISEHSKVRLESMLGSERLDVWRYGDWELRKNKSCHHEPIAPAFTSVWVRGRISPMAEVGRDRARGQV